MLLMKIQTICNIVEIGGIWMKNKSNKVVKGVSGVTKFEMNKLNN